MADELTVHRFAGRDGVDLAYRELGTGRPLVLIHGYFSSALVNWVRYGHAPLLARRGYRVIMPDLRGHGDSAKPHDPAAYPPDVLADDGFALVEQLGLADYDLGGYSLGGRTTVRMLIRGAHPGRAVVGGMGLEGIEHTGVRSDHFRRILDGLGTWDRRSPEGKAEAFLRSTGGDPVALRYVLDANVDTPRAALRTLTVPTLTVAGDDDLDNRSAADLAAALPAGRYVEVPGNHMSAVAYPALGQAITDFLGTP